MPVGDDRFRLELLSDTALAADPYPELPLRLVIEGTFSDDPEATAPASIEIRFGAEQLADLLTQLRTARTSLALRSASEPDRELLARVLAGLKSLEGGRSS